MVYIVIQETVQGCFGVQTDIWVKWIVLLASFLMLISEFAIFSCQHIGIYLDYLQFNLAKYPMIKYSRYWMILLWIVGVALELFDVLVRQCILINTTQFYHFNSVFRHITQFPWQTTSIQVFTIKKLRTMINH